MVLRQTNPTHPPLSCGKEIHRLALWYWSEKKIWEKSTFVNTNRQLAKVLDYRQNYRCDFHLGWQKSYTFVKIIFVNSTTSLAPLAIGTTVPKGAADGTVPVQNNVRYINTRTQLAYYCNKFGYPGCGCKMILARNRDFYSAHWSYGDSWIPVQNPYKTFMPRDKYSQS